MINSYFKLGKNQTFTFDENNPQSVRAAYTALMAQDANDLTISVYRPVPVPGPWSEINRFVGHRKLEEILADVQAAEDALTNEMNEKFDAAWRGVLAARQGELALHPLIDSRV